MNQVTPKQSIEVSLDIFIIALKASEAIDKELWDANVLNEHMLLKGQNESIWIPIHHHRVTPDELKTWATNMEYYAAGMMTIIIDEALNRFYGNHPLDDLDSERKAVRSINYLIRCTFAHEPIRPTWSVSSVFNEIWEVPSLGLRLDAPAVKGKAVKSSDYGGWPKLVLLAKYAIDLVT